MDEDRRAAGAADPEAATDAANGWAQNLMLPPPWALAKAFGVRPYYDRGDSRIAETGESNG
jgi:hypothetical protein